MSTRVSPNGDGFALLVLESLADLRARSDQARFDGDLRGYVDHVNAGHEPHWEQAEYDLAGGVIRIASRAARRCPCGDVMAPSPRQRCTATRQCLPPALFRALAGREVDVDIRESILDGAARCRATIRLRAR